MSGRVGILIFPGTNSEEETLRACAGSCVSLGKKRRNRESRMAARSAASSRSIHWKSSSERAR